MQLTDQQKRNFQEIIWDYYQAHGRSMPWRAHPEPYYVLVSELMLQQTQVLRVIPKFQAFIERFPDIEALAGANLSGVLIAWSGLGYNRRAKFLHEAAKKVQAEYGGQLPNSYDELVKLPGIGPNTAGAILAYAYNQPVTFIETNIRTVFIHHFFHDVFDVTDHQLRDVVEQTVDRDNPRVWYWALMDYGSHLKQSQSGRLDQSKHYKKQSPLAGSPREMRGRIIKALVGGPMSEPLLKRDVEADERFAPALAALRREGFIINQNDHWCLTADTDT